MQPANKMIPADRNAVILQEIPTDLWSSFEKNSKLI